MKSPLIWAHRGSPLGTGTLPPENSLTAFRRARELGADALEFDLHLTRDGHLVIYHDLMLEHPKLGLTSIPELTLSQVREVSLGEQNEKIPTFHQMLKAFPGDIPLIPELKSPEFANSLGLDPVAQLLQDIDEFEVSERIVIQCFHADTLEKIRGLRPHQSLLALYRHDQEVDIDNIPGRADYVGLPMLSVFFFGEQMVRQARERGVRVIPWREMSLSENPEVFDRLRDFQVEAIMVDDAQAALAHFGRCQEPSSHEKVEPFCARRCRKPDAGLHRNTP